MWSHSSKVDEPSVGIQTCLYASLSIFLLPFWLPGTVELCKLSRAYSETLWQDIRHKKSLRKVGTINGKIFLPFYTHQSCRQVTSSNTWPVLVQAIHNTKKCNAGFGVGAHLLLMYISCAAIIVSIVRVYYPSASLCNLNQRGRSAQILHSWIDWGSASIDSRFYLSSIFIAQSVTLGSTILG